MFELVTGHNQFYVWEHAFLWVPTQTQGKSGYATHERIMCWGFYGGRRPGLWEGNGMHGVRRLCGR